MMSKRFFLQALVACLSLTSALSLRGQCVAVANGNWGNSNTWGTSGSPETCTTFEIPSAIIVTTQQNDLSTNIATITVRGTLDFGGSGDLALPSGSSIILENGSISASNSNSVFTIGAASVTGPFSYTGSITITEANLNSVLPVELTRFTGRELDGRHILEWATATELDNAFFSVERSGDGRKFTEIGRLAGKGTTLEPQEYSYTDDAPLPGVNYYRLRQVDFDGQFEYSPVVSIRNRESGQRISAPYPNPSGDWLQVPLQLEQAQETTIAVLNTAGQVLRQDRQRLEPGSYQLPIELSGLPNGLYLLRITSGGKISCFPFSVAW